MPIELIREFWDYHDWANRRRFEVTAALGDDVARRDLGKQFSVLTLLGMLSHVCGFDDGGSSAGRACRRPPGRAARESLRSAGGA